MDVSIPEKRNTRRSNVLLAAIVEFDGKLIPVTLRNLSAEGALVSGDQLPEPGAAVLFRRKSLAVESCVVWSHAKHAGVMFARPLPKAVVLQHLPKLPQRPAPTWSGRPGFFCRALTDDDKSMIEEWASGSSTRLGA